MHSGFKFDFDKMKDIDNSGNGCVILVLGILVIVALIAIAVLFAMAIAYPVFWFYESHGWLGVVFWALAVHWMRGTASSLSNKD